MKKIILIFIMLGALMNANAQQSVQKSPEQKATAMADKLNKELALSADQKSKVYAAALDYEKKASAIKSQSSTDKKAMHAQMKPLKDTYTTAVKGILTPDQITKWEQMKAAKKAAHKNKHH